MKKNTIKKNSPLVWLLASLIFIVYLFVSFTNTGEPSTPITAPNDQPMSTPPVMGAVTSEPVLPSNPDWYSVYFTDPIRPYNQVITGGIEDNLIEMIDAAQTSIDIAFFEFDLENLAQAIIHASDRGVSVRIVYDNEHTDTDPQIDEMISAGIGATPDNRSAYMHNKFVVIDNQCVWTGSFNLTVNAAYKNNENAVVICDPYLAENYTTEFTEMYSGQFGTTSPANTPNPVFNIGSITLENYFSPEDNVMAEVIRIVSQATESIHFMVFSFTDDLLAAEMISRVENGVPVVGIFESRSAGTTSSVCPYLLANNAVISLDGNPYTFHHKVIIIDGSIVIFGSFNFTANANENNDENLLIVHDPAFAAEFEREFQRRLEESNSSLDAGCHSR